MRLSGIDEVSKVVSVIEVEGGKERKRGRNRETPLMKPSQLRSRLASPQINDETFSRFDDAPSEKVERDEIISTV